MFKNFNFYKCIQWLHFRISASNWFLKSWYTASQFVAIEILYNSICSQGIVFYLKEIECLLIFWVQFPCSLYIYLVSSDFLFVLNGILQTYRSRLICMICLCKTSSVFSSLLLHLNLHFNEITGFISSCERTWGAEIQVL